jgi:hypothetical protein
MFLAAASARFVAGCGRSGLFTENESSEAAGRRSIRYAPVKSAQSAMCRFEATLRFCSRGTNRARQKPSIDSLCAG